MSFLDFSSQSNWQVNQAAAATTTTTTTTALVATGQCAKASQFKIMANPGRDSSMLDWALFKSARKDPWQTEARNESDELFREKSLKEALPCYSRLLSLLGRSMRVGSIRMVATGPSDTQQEANSDASLKSGFVICDMISKDNKRPATFLFQFLSLIFVISLVHDQCRSSMLLYEHDKLIMKLTHKSRAIHKSRVQNSTTIHCLPSQSLPQDYLSDLDELTKLSEVLSSAGILVRAQTVVYFLALLTFAPVSFFYFLTSRWQMLPKQHINSNTLATIFFPYQSNKFLRKQIDAIIVKARNQLSHQLKCGPERMISRIGNTFYRLSWIQLKSCPRDLGARNEPIRRIFHAIKLLDIILKGKLVRPCIGSHAWFIQALMACYKYWSLYYTIVLPMICLIATVPFFIETFYYSIQRLDDLRCEHQNYVSTLYRIAGIGQLEPSDASKYEPFLTREPSWLERFQLAAFVESKHVLFNQKSLFQWSKFVVITLILSGWSTWWSFLYLSEFFSNTCLLVQVKSQLKSLIKELQQQRRERQAAGSRGQYPGMVSQEFQERIERKLLIAYVIFQLTRERYASYHNFKQLVMIQGFVFTLWSFSVMYLVASTMEAERIWQIIIISTSIIFYTNMILFTATYDSRLVKGIMKTFIGILINSSDLMPELRYKSIIFDLWQRNLLTEGEVVKMTTARIFHINITHTKLIVVNVNLIGLWLMMVRFQFS